MIKYPNSALKYVHHKIKRSNKYHAKKVEIDGITFDSKAESKYWKYINQKYCKNSNVEIKYHDTFVVINEFELAGKKHAARTYTPDFTIYEDGRLVKVVDVKGGKATMTDGASLRICLFEFKYQIPVTIATYDRSNNTFIEHDK